MNLAALQQQLDDLHRAGAQAFDPPRFGYLQALARRAQAQDERVRKVLEVRLASALADWNLRSAAAPAATLSRSASASPVTQPVSGAGPRPLADLLAYLAQHGHESGEAESAGGAEGLASGLASGFAGAPQDLKSVRHFRDTWSRLSTDKQVKKSLAQAPKNAGPLNSHMLVLRSLALMQEIAPDYLNRFISYADTLLCLEQREAEPAPRAPASGNASGEARKPKARRSRA